MNISTEGRYTSAIIVFASRSDINSGPLVYYKTTVFKPITNRLLKDKESKL